jgi:histidinol-phosphate/aromatic aminotransferase/cobyric acid decarboxylase-like protein
MASGPPVKVPFLDLKVQYHSIKPEIDAAVGKILESSQFVLGEEVAGFEREFAAYSGASQGIAVNSGTSALHLALLAAGVGPGDEVITVPNTFVATVAAIKYTGARPVQHVSRRPSRLEPRRSSRCTFTASPPTWTRSWRSPAGGN